MLSLEPPYYEIEGILVYRDHAEPSLFYYAAPHPQISRVGGRLLFDLFAYTVALEHSPLAGTSIPDELGAGFLTMGVDCALRDSQRRALLRDLEARTGLAEEEIALYPIPYRKGEVRVLALDRFSAPGEEPGEPASDERLVNRPTFVEKVLGSGRPSLLGDLRTIFSLQLSQEGVAFLEGLYSDDAAPVGVVYELTFYGLRPAVEAFAWAELSRIYEHFGGGVSAQYGWFRAEVDAAMDFLDEQSAFGIELTTQAIGEEAAKARELALSIFKDQIVRDMFKPIAAPRAPNPAEALGGLGAIATGATQGGVALSLQYKSAEELRRVEYHFEESSPEERVHAPQGFLPVMLGPDELQDRLHRVSLDHDFFKTLEVLVTGPTREEFDRLGIRQVEATLTYGDDSDPVPPESRTLLFRPDNTGDKTFSVFREGRESMAYQVQLTYEFERRRGVDTDSVTYHVPPDARTSRTYRINPYRDFGVLDVEIEPGRLPEDIREVDVTLGYEAPEDDFSATELVRLRPKDAPDERHAWQVRTLDPEVAGYSVAYKFVFEDNATYTVAPVLKSDPLLRVDSPFQHERKLLVTPNVISDDITMITVEIEYEDTENGYERAFHLSLEPEVEDGERRWKSRSMVWPILDADLQIIRYRAATHEPGFTSTGEWDEEDGPSIIVGSVGSRVVDIDVRLIGPSLSDVALDALMVKLRLVSDSATGQETSLFFEPGQGTSAVAELTVPPGESLRYEYMTTAFKADGAVSDSPWKESTTALLPISTRAL